jgi:hypothetical protein
MLLNVIFKPFFAPDVHAGRISSLHTTEKSEVHMSTCAILLWHILNPDIQEYSGRGHVAAFGDKSPSFSAIK